MTKIVVDASALLALLNNEPGADIVAEAIPDAVISTINLSEVIAKLSSAGMPEETIRFILQPLGLNIPFAEEQAYRAGVLHATTQGAGISLGDRACLSLAQMLEAPVLTADRSWVNLPINVKIKVIR